MNKTYETAKRMAKRATLVGLAALALGGIVQIEKNRTQRQRELATRFGDYAMSQELANLGFRQYIQRNGSRVAVKDYEDGTSKMIIDANRDGYFEKEITY